ncbi:hypothetical protein [Phenylobacterium sp.]|jgi:hypothetical protein|uniref:hypothetical protein n=1 Tax=Phenylobacterium sp. TaxID=1871053 RepID=UPI002E339899|nr:hypothetical protein [Phenylobacterium sp.]HEX4709487.1 hypothetical protein [Phenylobacterium sp.]
MSNADKPIQDRAEPIDQGLSTASLAGAAPPRPDQEPAEPRTFADGPAGREPRRDAEPMEATPLFTNDEAGDLRGRWDAIQAGFVDEPRRAVEQADSLVAGAMKRLAEMFAEERARLEGQWDRGDDVSTEDLRVALQRYRSFFGRLLSM